MFEFITKLLCLGFFVQLFELGPDGGDHETDGDLLAETDVLAYDCAARWSSSWTIEDIPTHIPYLMTVTYVGIGVYY